MSLVTCNAVKILLCKGSNSLLYCRRLLHTNSLCYARPGPCFTVTPKGFVTANHWLATKHSEYMKGEGVKGSKRDQNVEPPCQSLRAGFGSSPHKVELFLVPVNAVSGNLSAYIPCLPSFTFMLLLLSNAYCQSPIQQHHSQSPWSVVPPRQYLNAFHIRILAHKAAASPQSSMLVLTFPSPSMASVNLLPAICKITLPLGE